MLISKVIQLTSTQELNFKSLKEVAEATTNMDWSPFLFKDSYRHGVSWSACDLMVLDVDKDCSIETAKELFANYQYAIITTRNHQKIKHEGEEPCDRFRVIIPLTHRIIDKEMYKNTWYKLSNKYSFIDPACKDFGRFYYKGIDIVAINETGDRIIPEVQTIMPNSLKKTVDSTSGLQKGKLSRTTLEFLFTEAERGEWNTNLFKAAKDFQEQGYTEEEFILKAQDITGFLDSKDSSTIRSAYTNDPKYDPRGIQDRKELVGMTVNELLASGTLGQMGERIQGPVFWDSTERGWRKGEVLGLIAGSGTGKSSVSLFMIKNIIEQNNNDDLHFFFSLEMPARVVVERWLKLVGTDSKLSNRLIVVDNKTSSDRLTWQHLVRFVNDTCSKANKKPGCVVLDHFMAISDKIDTTIEPNFDVSTDINSGRGKIKSINTKEMCRIMHVVAEHLNCFLIVQNQSTKERAGQGDSPLGINAAYGAAQFEWFSDYIMTVWQPLKRVADKTYLTCSAWQYCKIREKGPRDDVKEYVRHHLHFDVEYGRYRIMNDLEEIEFNKMIQLANEHRKADDKKENNSYKSSPNGLARNSWNKLKLIKNDREDQK